MNSQNREIEQVATAMTEMAMTVKDVSGNASSAASAVSDANQFIEKGQSVTRDTIDSIDRLAKNIDDATVAVEKVNARTDDIGRILTVIKDIADQTNLLALNAAIEAARAGDQGRGFSVVADEVRNLAQRTQLSTTEIQEMIETLQTETSAAVALIQSGKVISGSSVELIKETGDALNCIKDSIGHIYMMSTQIATASEQQATVATQMDRSLSAINEQSNETQRELQASELSSCELAALSQQLSGEVATFKFA
jgi:methyl-accepting chemotaxis protein